MGAIKDFAEPVRGSITQLENEIADLEKQLEGVDEIYAQMRTKKKQIALLQKTMAQLDGTAPVAAGTNRPRGQNLKDIQAFLDEQAEACTPSDLKTELHMSQRLRCYCISSSLLLRFSHTSLRRRSAGCRL